MSRDSGHAHRPGREQEEGHRHLGCRRGRGFALFGSGLLPMYPSSVARRDNCLGELGDFHLISSFEARLLSPPSVRQVTPCSEEAAALVSQVKMALLRRGGPSGGLPGTLILGVDDLDNIRKFARKPHQRGCRAQKYVLLALGGVLSRSCNSQVRAP